MKIRKFTLIELIVVIAILGILATIIVVNVTNPSDEAQKTGRLYEIQITQKAVDLYVAQNMGEFPVPNQPTLGNPKQIDFRFLQPKYITKVPTKYPLVLWVDYSGTVWGSEADSPEGLVNDGVNLTWEEDTNAVEYKIYKEFFDEGQGVVKMKHVGTVPMGTNTFPSGDTDSYFISSVDENGFESAPVNANYSGIPSVNQYMKFGNYNGKDLVWRIVYFNHDKMYLILDDVLKQPNGATIKKSFDASSNNWNTSSLKTWLNSDFYDNAFDSTEKTFFMDFTDYYVLPDSKIAEKSTGFESHIYNEGIKTVKQNLVDAYAKGVSSKVGVMGIREFYNKGLNELALEILETDDYWLGDAVSANDSEVRIVTSNSGEGSVTKASVTDLKAIKPIIVISPSVDTSGDGTESNPYVVK